MLEGIADWCLLVCNIPYFALQADQEEEEEDDAESITSEGPGASLDEVQKPVVSLQFTSHCKQTCTALRVCFHCSLLELDLFVRG